jgi:alpha-tubulin suppressor-like RCC1 family protein
VYVWGDNEYHKLGLNSLKTPKVPKIIPNLVDIRTVCPLRKTTIFLDNNGFLYFCGTYSSGDSGLDNCEQCTPRKMDSDIKFSGLYCVKSEHHGYIIPVCSGTNGNTIYNILKTMQISHTEYSDIDVYYAYNMQMTRDMIDLDNVQNSIVNSTFNKLGNFILIFLN